MHAHQRPKLEAYDDLLFAVVKTVHYDDQLPGGTAEVVETGEVMVFVGANFVITVRHGEHGGLQRVRKRLEADPDLLSLGPSVVLHAVLDSIVDSYVSVCRALQEDIDEAETGVFTSTTKITDSNVIYVLKREVLELRRATAPLGPVLRHLSHGSARADRPERARLLPRRRRSPDRGRRPGQRLRRPAHHAGVGQPGARVGRAERGHAQDLGLGRDRRRADDARRASTA